MLELIDVVKEYRVGGQVVRALDRVGLRIESGEFTAIVGPSGSGKSTLLHLLGALDCPDSGSIRFRGEEIADLDDDRQSEFRRHRVGFVFQFFNLLPTLSAWENVAVPKLLDGTGLRRAKPRALELLDLVGLADRAHHRPSELSGGQMQRVAVARALIMDPPLILADEPTGNLDSATGAAILELLGDIAAQGNSVVMVTHDMSAVEYCDRVITLRDGRIGAQERTGRERAAGPRARKADAPPALSLLTERPAPEPEDLASEPEDLASEPESLVPEPVSIGNDEPAGSVGLAHDQPARGVKPARSMGLVHHEHARSVDLARDEPAQGADLARDEPAESAELAHDEPAPSTALAHDEHARTS
ncbi:Vitamin B12 import ATP-binding protein BtuD [Nocardia sp. RB56]|uniref:Vitamin B12 import ATP-binding protein BtuD n=1 Tax=Nocardia aurantia TaxID=2585199 RepID=A0A7K0DV27_9NOCA|nr:Vitamin B12 import ATP-binding protein BtuD [Nocardia aurantia]